MADLIAAWRRLGVEEREQARRVAAVLGFDLRPDPPSSKDPVELSVLASDTKVRSRDSARATAPAAEDNPQPSPDLHDLHENLEGVEPVAEELEGVDSVAERFEVVESVAETPPPPHWWQKSEPVKHRVRPAEQKMPLLAADQRAQIIEILARSIAPTGGLDELALVEALAALRPIHAPPQLLEPSLSRPLTVLVDRRPEMMPFRADAHELVDALTKLLGPLLEVFSFPSSPLHPGPGFVTGELSLPAPHSSLLVLSALDVFGETQPWLDLAQLAQRAEVAVAALCPYRPARLSNDVHRAFPVLYWSARLSTVDMVAVLDGRRRIGG